jgi:tellurite resistance protein TehA-like permease
MLSVLICFPVLMIWYNAPHDIKTFSPAWAFPVFPLMLIGVVASNVLRVVTFTDPRALGVLIVGYIFQG